MGCRFDFLHSLRRRGPPESSPPPSSHHRSSRLSHQALATGRRPCRCHSREEPPAGRPARNSAAPPSADRARGRVSGSDEDNIRPAAARTSGLRRHCGSLRVASSPSVRRRARAHRQAPTTVEVNAETMPRRSDGCRRRCGELSGAPVAEGVEHRGLVLPLPPKTGRTLACAAGSFCGPNNGRNWFRRSWLVTD